MVQIITSRGRHSRPWPTGKDLAVNKPEGKVQRHHVIS